MNAIVKIGDVSIEVTNASAAELIDLAKAGNGAPAPKTDVVAVTREAITTNTKSKNRRTINYIPWLAADLGFIANMALDLGPDAKTPGSAIAKAMKSRPGNKRLFKTLYAMSYNIVRYLREGNETSLSRSNIEDLNSMGFTAGMMSKPKTTNMLGEVRQLEVRQA